MNGKQLKNSILQWAIQGKLVPQDPNDEPASVLLERIREEKARLVKEGKIKKDKNESIIFRGDDNSYYEKFLATGEVKCIDDEIPFEIPEGWEWTRMGNIGDWGSGSTPQRGNSSYYGGSIPWLKTGELNDGVVYDTAEKITDKALKECSLRLNKIGDILIAMYGATIGKVAIAGIDLTTNQACCGCTPIIVYNEYLFYFLMASKVDFVKKGEGGAQPNISREKLVSHLMPIPPIDEQQRIVLAIKHILPYVTKYTRHQTELDRLNASIKPSLKKSILQEAIQGKLVPQDPNDEPASVLLERIREEKAKLFKEGKLKKKDLVDSVIFKGEDNKYFEKIGKEIICIDDDIPFDIPISWEWVRLGNLFQHNTGKALNGSNQKGTLYEYITTSNLYWNQFVLDKLRQMLFTNEELEKCTVRKGDLLICEGGDIGRCAIWNYDYDIRIQNHIHRLRAFTPVCTSFFYYTMYLYKHIGLIGGKGIGIQGLSSNALHKLLLPLPPMNEQQRIVNKIESAIASIMRK